LKKLLALIILFAVAAGAWLVYAVFVPLAPTEQKFVSVKSGASIRQVARELERAGVIRSRFAFLAVHQFEHRTAKAGEYEFERSANALDVYDRLARGDVYFSPVVIPEGFNIFDIAQALDAAKLCSRADFLNVARTATDLVNDIDPQAKSLEGYLFPDTYNFGRNQSAREIATEMVRRFKREAVAIGLRDRPDVHRVVTLASIVEKETGRTEERRMIAGVFENRMRKHVGLATDPSVIYASLLIGKYDGVIHQSDLALDSPYNTYKYAGLPPGPIANPGRTALVAAMNPTPTDYLYFVANNKGGHNFAKTLDEHNRNVTKYRQGQK